MLMSSLRLRMKNPVEGLLEVIFNWLMNGTYHQKIHSLKVREQGSPKIVSTKIMLLA